VLCGTTFARDPTAPLAMGLILELTRNIGRESARMHAGEPWQAHLGIEIEGRTLGIIGLGKLGTKVSKLAQAFGMNVIAWSPNLTPEKCKEAGVTYASKIEKNATRIDWTRPWKTVHDHCRGLSPFPGAWFELPGAGAPARIKVLRTTRGEGTATPGTVIDDKLTVACGDGAVRILELQRAGRQPMKAEEFLRGTPLAADTRLT